MRGFMRLMGIILSAVPLVLGVPLILAAPLSLAPPAFAQNPTQLIVEAEESLIWERNERRYIAQGNARVEYGSLVLTADRIEAEYADDGGDASGGDLRPPSNDNDGDLRLTAITHIRASGEVVLIDTAGGRRELQADTLVFEVEGRIATLTGSVVIIDGGNRITGDVAEINLTDGTSAVRVLDGASGGRVTGVFLTPAN